MEYHILVAEDEPELRSLLRYWFDEKVPKALPGKYIVYEAGDGNEAMAKVAECLASEHSLDLAIVDLRMPGKNGFETIDDLLKTFPTTHVLLLSATISFFLDRLGEYGSRVTPLDKPISSRAFVDAVTNILGSGGNRYA